LSQATTALVRKLIAVGFLFVSQHLHVGLPEKIDIGLSPIFALSDVYGLPLQRLLADT